MIHRSAINVALNDIDDLFAKILLVDEFKYFD